MQVFVALAQVLPIVGLWIAACLTGRAAFLVGIPPLIAFWLWQGA
ncbi:hypothetical protein [Paramagnetospirillum magneticum]|uniref:Uncharacterized protein n=1 Tax=Paramagnetospirillum magneticum (strain ATCC 700264 / AMB-1) TaxID=342108 RepID=Q2W6F9_PARM1|nr:hypothetical protein [Paramagnetospirillum magneticum]BAE50566.1 hypothetical protein amb1762 [Paramagnetospirillum magneticum AMB-1]